MKLSSWVKTLTAMSTPNISGPNNTTVGWVSELLMKMEQGSDWAQTQDLALCNTFFTKPNSHLVTYSSGNHKKQVDFWAFSLLPKLLKEPSRDRKHSDDYRPDSVILCAMF
ncbi:hypothetical protein GJ496_005245 [Pomphorhynchus laevis]|nr:hypothetical protein GJ496_005245 [Pomphorhynchus laevis]